LGKLANAGTRVVLGHLLKPICEAANALFPCSAYGGGSHRRGGIVAQTAKPNAWFEITVPSQAIEKLQADLWAAVGQKPAKLYVLLPEAPAPQRGFA
jgi:hypothetical protein